MTLKFYNTLTRQKENFHPLDKNHVRVYVCGPTVYDFAHIGNARPVIVFDVLFRLLRHVYGETKVTYIRNITDVDDKINARALRDYPGLLLNEAIRRVTEATASQFHQDVQALACLAPSQEPRATDNIEEMIRIISQLIDKTHAYVAEGEVLFDVTSMADYGALSHRKLEDQQAGARVAVDAHKRNPGDFVLWKLSAAQEPGWNSPWGRGRPGWHIECSAMSKRYLGEVFDIHGGGLDLIFPHHENELAQSRCAFGHKQMAQVWMHNGFLQIEGQKMSKSLGNFFTINDLLATNKFGGRAWPGSVLRLAMLMTHYRQPIDWTASQLTQSLAKLNSWSQVLKTVTPASTPSDELIAALSDDLNVHMGLVSIEKSIAQASPDSLSAAKADLAFLGIDVDAFASQLEGVAPALDEQKITSLIEARLTARQNKNWAESDRLRDELDALGVAIKDTKDGTTSWAAKP